MNKSTIHNAVESAKRFIRAASIAAEELAAANCARYILGTKASGACRRASLDLTRALAEMRKAT